MTGPWAWRWRRRGPGRPPKPRYLSSPPPQVVFVPYVSSERIDAEPIIILPDEYEALRLVYYEGLTQEDAAKKMGVSRGTLWRALNTGRRKLVQAIVERRPIVIKSIS